MIIKNEIPILEFDTEKSAVLNPDHEKLPIKLPERAVFAFLGDEIDIYAERTGAKRVAHFESATKNYPIYITEYKGQSIALCQAPVGASASAQIMDWLIAYGVRKIISAGSCGVLSDIEENQFLIPYTCLRDEGTSYHYLPPSRYVDADKTAIEAIEKALNRLGIRSRKIKTWSTDGFYRETKEKVTYRRGEGCEAVEMECSALCAVAKMRGATFGMLLYSADTLASLDSYLERSWGSDAKEKALTICLEAISLL